MMFILMVLCFNIIHYFCNFDREILFFQLLQAQQSFYGHLSEACGEKLRSVSEWRSGFL